MKKRLSEVNEAQADLTTEKTNLTEKLDEYRT